MRGHSSGLWQSDYVVEHGSQVRCKMWVYIFFFSFYFDLLKIIDLFDRFLSVYYQRCLFRVRWRYFWCFFLFSSSEKIYNSIDILKISSMLYFSFVNVTMSKNMFKERRKKGKLSCMRNSKKLNANFVLFIKSKKIIIPLWSFFRSTLINIQKFRTLDPSVTILAVACSRYWKQILFPPLSVVLF